MASKKTISVRILDQNFAIASDAPPERIKKVAEFLNKNLNEAMTKSKGASPYNAAILAALNIAEKYFDAIEEKNRLKLKVAEKSEKILGLLESASLSS
jgi:cell division protein ZapA (FtsZ GTPase activity inhibitor)